MSYSTFNHRTVRKSEACPKFGRKILSNLRKPAVCDTVRHADCKCLLRQTELWKSRDHEHPQKNSDGGLLFNSLPPPVFLHRLIAYFSLYTCPFSGSSASLPRPVGSLHYGLIFQLCCWPCLLVLYAQGSSVLPNLSASNRAVQIHNSTAQERQLEPEKPSTVRFITYRWILA